MISIVWSLILSASEMVASARARAPDAKADDIAVGLLDSLDALLSFIAKASLM